MVAHNSIETLLRDLNNSKNCLNFWRNFGLNFKDRTFVSFFLGKSEFDNKIFIQKKLHEILTAISNYLFDNFASQEKFQQTIEPDLFNYLEILMIFLDTYENINQSEVRNIIDKEMKDKFELGLSNLSFYSRVDVRQLLEVLYEKVGYAFVDFKGNFIWADKYSSEVLFEQRDINKCNLFELMTDYAKFIIRNKYGEQFYDFKKENCRIRTFTYSINVVKEEVLMQNKSDNFFFKLFNNLNNNKTLVSRASTVLLQNYEDNKPFACILLETKFSRFRQNFDYFHWRCYLN